MRASMEKKTDLPTYVEIDASATSSRPQARPRRAKLSRGLRAVLGTALSLAALQYFALSGQVWRTEQRVQVPLRAQEWLEKCQLLDVPPGPPADFHKRTLSDRFVPETMPTFIAVRSR